MLALAIGKFDALHLGHRALVERAAALGDPALLTFSGMAGRLGWTERQPLVAPSDRPRILGEWGRAIGREVGAVSLPFADIQGLDPAGFIALCRDQLGAAALVAGEDFRFGRGRSGDAADLTRLAAAAGLASAIVPAVRLDGEAISSSRVRAALERGDCAQITACLGRPHRLVGTVVRGDGRGRALGFPTANCGERENQAPPSGVYAARAWIDTSGPWPAAVNAGHLPTIAAGRAFTVEAHLIGYDGDCYGSRIELDLLARLREERRFADLEALRRQVGEDTAHAARLAGG